MKNISNEPCTYSLIFWAGENSHGFSAAIHRTGCKDLEREARDERVEPGYGHLGPFSTVVAALNDYLDGDLEELGYDESIVHLPACTS